jgi:hypothetical protein
MLWTLHTLFDRYAPAAFDQQLLLEELAGKSAWSLDLSTGILSFGNQFSWRVQVLGTESHMTNTWLWAWANEASLVPPDLLRASLAMRGFGFLHRITEFMESEIPLGAIDGHYLAMIASGVCQANCYYRAPYDGGAVFLLINDSSFPRNQESPIRRICSVFPQAISTLHIQNHRLAFSGYYEHYGLAFESIGNEMAVKQNGETVLTAIFDGQNRLTELKAKITAESATS